MIKIRLTSFNEFMNKDKQHTNLFSFLFSMYLLFVLDIFFRSRYFIFMKYIHENFFFQSILSFNLNQQILFMLLEYNTINNINSKTITKLIYCYAKLIYCILFQPLSKTSLSQCPKNFNHPFFSPQKPINPRRLINQ